MGTNKGIWRVFDSVSYALILFPLLDFVNGYKLTGLLGLFSYFCYYLWNGNKFGPFLTLLIVFFLVNYENLILLKKNKLKKYIFYCAVLLLLLVLVASILAVNVQHNNMIDYVSGRLAQQGQLWWKTFYLTKNIHFNEIQDEIDGALHGYRLPFCERHQLDYETVTVHIREKIISVILIQQD